MDVPCGRCTNCRVAQREEWILRLRLEAKSSPYVHFLTLTYDDFCVPKLDDGLMVLNKRDIQLFFKRLRKKYPAKVLRYFAAGEYGKNGLRPHYHIMLFSKIPIHREDIFDSWKNGYIDIKISDESAAKYVAKYLNKSSGPLIKRIQASIPKEYHPFHLQSLGIGRDFFRKLDYYTVVVKRRIRVGKREVPVPKYYVDKIMRMAEKGQLDVTKQEVQHDLRMASRERQQSDFEQSGLPLWDYLAHKARRIERVAKEIEWRNQNA